MAAEELTKTKLLAIDDSEDDLMLFERLISRSNLDAEFYSASDRNEAFRILENHDIDCILLDYHLTADDGVSVLTRISQYHPYAAVIMLTGQGSEDVAAVSMKLGAADYVSKTRLSAEILTRCISNAVHKNELRKKIAAQQAEQRQFLNTLVHDIKAPLKQLSALSRLMGDAIDDRDLEEIRTLHNLVSKVSARSVSLVDSLEAYALRDGGVKFSPTALKDVAADAVSNLEKVIAEAGAEVKIGELPVIEGHAPQLIQVFQNLIGNGIKYNRAEKPAVTIGSSAQPDGGVLIEIADNGIGFEPEEAAAVFKPFHRLNNGGHFEGTGLGLAICEKAVRRHNGRIWCESRPGRGSRFFIEFPEGTLAENRIAV